MLKSACRSQRRYRDITINSADKLLPYWRNGCFVFQEIRERREKQDLAETRESRDCQDSQVQMDRKVNRESWIANT